MSLTTCRPLHSCNSHKRFVASHPSLMSSKQRISEPLPSGPTTTPKSFSFSIDSLVNGSSRKRSQISPEKDEHSCKRQRSLSPKSSTTSITPPAGGQSPLFTASSHQPQSFQSQLPGLGFPVADAAKLLQHQHHSHHPLSRSYPQHAMHQQTSHHPLAVDSNPFLTGSPSGFLRPATGFDAYNPSAIYPWLLASRHPGLGHFAGNMMSAPIPFMLPYRKPKRIRTAFSPNQLLKLEQAFEKNHYVVGAERKQLAASLNLTETQVKVWYQNRRTKHKRQGDEGSGEDGISDGDMGHEELDMGTSCNSSDSEDESNQQERRAQDRREGHVTTRTAHSVSFSNNNNGTNTDLRTS